MMMSQKFLMLNRSMSLFILLFTISAINILGQQDNPLLAPPQGDWSFGISFYHGLDKQDFPVEVWQVTSEIDAGVGATKIGIINNSDKTVTAVRFKWLLFEGEKRNKVLQQGSTPLLALRTTLEPEDKRILLYQVVSLLQVYRPLLKKELLNGDFEAEILVEEVHFADKSVWRKGDKQAKRQKIQENSKVKITPVSLAQCPRQKCKSNRAGTGGTVYYSCEASEFNEGCSPTPPDYRNCNNSACGLGGGGGIQEETPIVYPGNP